VIGTVGPISVEEYPDLKKAGYSLNEIIGKDGIEKSEESYLRGINGTEDIEINASGQVISTGDMTKNPQPGGNVVLTIDSDLQKVVQNALPEVINTIKQQSGGSLLHGAEANSGAAVVIDIKTGEVLAMASYPSYNLSTYSKDYSQLVTDPAKPLMNRAIQGLYRPGSAFKPAVAVTGLMNGIITPTSTIKTAQYFHKGTFSFYDEVGGDSKNVETALAQSSNFFFMTVADRLYTTGQFTKLVSTAKALGLGVKTGIELPAEATGTVSGPAEKAAAGGTWYIADPAQSGIGQLDNYYTPLQLADYIGTIVNGGTKYKVHIVKKVTNYDNSKTLLDNEPEAVKTINIPNLVVQTVKQGMLKVTEAGDGTATSVFQNFPLQLGGKTGTAQVSANGVNLFNGVFVSFAPYDNPQIAVAVVIEHGHNGYQTAPVARDAYNYLFVHNQLFTTTGLPSQNSQTPSQVNQLLP
jgi:penicillin-binding protein 2